MKALNYRLLNKGITMFGLTIVKSNTVYKLQDEVFDLRHQNTELRYDINRLIRDKKELFDDCFNLRNQNGVLIEKVNRLEIENRKLLDGTKQTQQQNMQQQALADIATPTRTQTRKEVYEYPSGGLSRDNGNISASDIYIAAILSEAPTTTSKVSSHSSSSDSASSPSDSSSYSSYSDNSSSSSSCSSDSGSSSSCGGD